MSNFGQGAMKGAAPTSCQIFTGAANELQARCARKLDYVHAATSSAAINFIAALKI